LSMYKLDKTVSAMQTHEEAERKKVFDADVSLAERLRQAWYLTCKAFGIDPQNPPKMVKEITGMRKHSQ
jgi:hypothetical protein